MVVDYSRFHDTRIDNQLATDTLIPDVGRFQTLQDFPRWKKEGEPLLHKPAGFSTVHPALRDRDGAWVAIRLSAFSFMYEHRGGRRERPEDAGGTGRPALEGPDRLLLPQRRRRVPLPLQAVRRDVRLGLGRPDLRPGHPVRARHPHPHARHLPQAEGHRCRCRPGLHPGR